MRKRTKHFAGLKEIGVLVAIVFAWCWLATAPYAQTPLQTQFFPHASPFPLQSSDMVVCTRAGVTLNCQWPPNLNFLPVATAGTNGISHPGSGMTVDGTGALNITSTAGSFQIVLGSLTTANPYSSGSSQASGFYAVSANVIGIGLNHVAAMQWNTLASGVDYINVTPGKSGTTPLIKVAGATANQGLNLTGTGTGAVTVNGVAFSSAGIVTGLTYDTAGASNVFKVNGTAISAVTGTGNVVLSASPTLTGTMIGASANFSGTTTVNNIIITGTCTGCGSAATAVAKQAAYYTTSTAIGGTGIAMFNTTTAAINSWSFGASTTGNPLNLTASGPDTNISANIQGKGTGTFALKGTGTADAASAGYIGEYLAATTSVGGATPLTTATPINVQILNLTAGDWLVLGQVNFYGAPTTSVTSASAMISTTSGAVPSSVLGSFYLDATTWGFANLGVNSGTLSAQRISLSSTTTVYMTAKALFSTSTAAAGGNITAWRVR